jgi:hypothetical protein
MPFANDLAALRALAAVAFTKLTMTYTTSERDYEHKKILILKIFYLLAREESASF